MSLNNSVEARLKGKEEEVLRVVREKGRKEAMAKFGIKAYISFSIWLKCHRDGLFALNPLAGFNGGEKAKWLRLHKETILDYMDIFGRDEVMDRFCLKEETLHSLEVCSSYPFRQKLTRLERAELDAKEALHLARETKQRVDTFIERLEIVDEERREETRAVETIHEAFYTFKEDTAKQVTRGFAEIVERLVGGFLDRAIKPSKKIPLPPEKPDLSINSLFAHMPPTKKELKDNPLLETIARVKQLEGVKK